MELKNIVPWGRSFTEYRDMFSLTEDDLAGRILGCGDGPASFNKTLSGLGGNIVSVDPVYQFSHDELKSRIDTVYDEVISQVEKSKEKYVWASISSVEELGRIRMESMAEFLSDYEAGRSQGRYEYGALPILRFPDQQFDLALCSHFMFLYSEHFTEMQHIESMFELCRVAKEVRIYPLLSLNGELSPHVDPVMDALFDSGIENGIQKVKYEFQKGATKMMVVKSG